MKLLIVESKTKAKTLCRILGLDYQILASVGHIYELADKNNAIDIKNDFTIKYNLLPRARQNIKTIINSAKEAEIVFLATDPDREGETIAWHLEQEICRSGVNKNNVKRVTFQEITQSTVRNAVLHSRNIDMNLVQAQQSRVALDYLIGFNLSPILWRKLPGARSAGRVQSAVLRLICEREIEIKKFCPQEYWSVDCLLQGKNIDHKILTLLIVIDGKKLNKFDLSNQKMVKDASAQIQHRNFTCVEIKDTDKKISPKPPLITSTLQQMAFNRCNIYPMQTMQVAQQLYEGVSIDSKFTGLITYMRTDSVLMSQEFIESVRKYIKSEFSADYVPKEPVKHKQLNKLSQEAHECIRPTNVEMHPDKIKAYLTQDQYQIYSLIWHYSVASQMSHAVVQSRHIVFKHHDRDIMCRGHLQKTSFDGFMKLMQRDTNIDSCNDWIQTIKVGDKFVCDEVRTKQHFTEPPAHYNEGSLIKTMEKYGIGRPSTYAHVLHIIKKRNYVKAEKNKLEPSYLGFAVTIFLCSLFRKYTESSFTAKMENNLDRIATGELNRSDFLQTFWHFFAPQIESVMKKDYQQINDIIADYLTDHQLWDRNKICNKCNNKMLFSIIRGNFLYACSQYPKCKNCIQIFDDRKNNEQLNTLSDKPLWQEDTGNVYLRLGPYGYYLSLESNTTTDKKKITNVSIPDRFCHISVEILRKLIHCPLDLGADADGNIIRFCCGKYGPYLQYNKQNITINNVEDVKTLTLAKAQDIISEHKKKPYHRKKKLKLRKNNK